ncbi:MAG: hypothetical protein JRG91_10825 [Deltaproteobacteria bacterium]|nr:hypothetical protein [Deltaproteobacteria bacterium]
MTHDTRASGLVVASVLLAACGPPCAREGRCIEQVDDGLRRHSMILTSEAVSCTPYEGWETLETPQGEIVSGVEVCAEWEDACWCERNESTRFGMAVVLSDPESGSGCLSWDLVESEFWAYPHGTVCPTPGGWSLDLDAYPDSACGIAILPQVEWNELTRMEVVCEWTTDDGTVFVTDRLYFQLLP